MRINDVDHDVDDVDYNNAADDDHNVRCFERMVYRIECWIP